eukprot:gnl/TRDRNA2_/TRDRNA2_182436_c0_seq1.p1 gnl/TRDRNA2_/TRDRNA2_182436_c0~~gnl/TRDRNA2_/TRDRNA2_182436_c0_seq1.p1  ORF type:complete len:317 (-),score=32.77 gnl/TRDRNA2_/TRDRNA2_182436_c0_seq1:79-1029(-)
MINASYASMLATATLLLSATLPLALRMQSRHAKIISKERLRLLAEPTTSSIKDCDDLVLTGDEDEGIIVETLSGDCQSLRSNKSIEEDKPPPLSAEVKFVHVGKSAGLSIMKWLDSNYVPFEHVHLKRVTDCDPGLKRVWVIPIRDPLERVMSAFNWRSPRNNFDNKTANPLITREKELYSCFTNIDEFALGLNMAGRCGSLARKMWRQPWNTEHLGKGLAYYFAKNLDCVMSQDPHLVRMRFIEHDLHQLAGRLNLTKTNMTIEHTHTSYLMEKERKLSDEGRATLLKYLEPDYEVLGKLMHLWCGPKNKPECVI